MAGEAAGIRNNSVEALPCGARGWEELRVRLRAWVSGCVLRCQVACVGGVSVVGRGGASSGGHRAATEFPVPR